MADNDDSTRRPSPEALLRTAADEARSRRGRLKIFLGAAPGVGKTFTMLDGARFRAMGGEENIVIGVVETHGRSETAELMLGLDIVPRRKVEYQGHLLEEMDLDAILARRPSLVLVDELAHTNAPSCRHPKRYMDVEELLDAGVDVYTTLNIQHLESLNDAVARITGIRVRETVPDRFLERADEVELVDISVQDLLDRLREGKVYVPDQAERAIRNYFRPGNLSALRQLALRHMAERVDEQMHSYMQAHAIPGPWPATERLLVSVGPSPLSPRLVRATRRRAERRHAEWIAVYVETPAHYRLSEADRDRVAGTLRLAEELGGETLTVPGASVSEELLHVARARNVTEIVVGKSHRGRVFELMHGSIVADLVRNSGEIDVFVISGEGERAEPREAPRGASTAPTMLRRYLTGAATVALAAAISSALKANLALPNLSLIFLLAVLASGITLGLGPSIFVSVASVLVYDFFFVPPHYTFTISSPQDVLALVTFLVVAVLTSNLTSRVRDQVVAARKREARTGALLSLTRVLSTSVGMEDVAHAVVHQLSQNLQARAVLLVPRDEMLMQQAAEPAEASLTEAERGAATWSWRNGRPAGRATDTLSGERWLYHPLRTANGVVGVIALRFEQEEAFDPEHRRLIEALCAQAALALERAALTRDLEQARLLEEQERLQAILLSSISHDLRTPLASIIGAASSLQESPEVFDAEARRDLLATIHEEAERLNRFVGNLLDTTRIESGALKLDRDWVEVQDVIGSAAGRLAARLKEHPFSYRQDDGLPMVRLDFVLMEQVFVNLLDNAAKYSPAGAPIRVRARRHEEMLEVTVEDEGAGVPREDLEKIFDKFFRVHRGDRQMAGSGLGLSICRAIVAEHGGRITASSPGPHGRGTVFSLLLPIEDDPALAHADAINSEEQ